MTRTCLYVWSAPERCYSRSAFSPLRFLFTYAPFMKALFQTHPVIMAQACWKADPH